MIQSQSLQLTKIFLSSTIWAHGHHHGAPFAFGRQHYSYEVARRKFATALHHLGLEIHDVPRPEIYAAPVSRQFLSGNCCHLIFKPTEWIRLLKGVKNIACVAWEFDRLTAPTRGSSHPFKDMRRMLMLPDEVWTPCEFTRQVFQANGIRNVYRIPAPISVPSAPVPIQFPEIPPDLDRVSWINLRVGFGRYRDLNRSVPSRPYRLSDIILDYYQGRQPQIFVSVLNPHDLRKNLTSLIGGFLEFHAENPNSLLLLKLIVDNTSDRLDNVLTGLHLRGRAEVWSVLAARRRVRAEESALRREAETIVAFVGLAHRRAIGLLPDSMLCSEVLHGKRPSTAYRGDQQRIILDGVAH